MKHRMSSEFIYQLFALLIAVIVVHAVYVGAIRREMELQAAGEDYVPERTFAVVIRDFEQEACFILLLWALAIMAYKGRRNVQEQGMLDLSLLDIPEGTTVLPEDAREYSRSLEALPDSQQDLLLPRTLLSALQRFATTGNIQAVSDTIKETCEIEADLTSAQLPATTMARPTRRWRVIFPGLRSAWGWLSTAPSLRWYCRSSSCSACISCSCPRNAWCSTASATPTNDYCGTW